MGSYQVREKESRFLDGEWRLTPILDVIHQTEVLIGKQ